MHRPSLTPITFDDFERPSLNPWDIGKWLFRHSLRYGLRFISYFARLLVWTLRVDLAPGKERVAIPVKSIFISICVLFALTAPAMFATCVWIVYTRTHPAGPGTAEPFLVSGVFSEQVSFSTQDGLRLSGHYAPAVTVSDVLRGEEVLTRRYPAVVLVHDHGEDSRQMLPLVARLNQLGCHVLAVDLRGAGRSQESAQTFGQAERYDVEAAVNFLAGRPSVDGERIAVWGVGTGGVAATLAIPSVSPALVIHERSLEAPELDGRRFIAGGLLGDVAQPMCRWIFRLAYARDMGAGDGSARRVVPVPAGDREAALAELENFASDRLRLASN